jgi:two-component system, chemotaxis family, sensor kinase CheA
VADRAEGLRARLRAMFRLEAAEHLRAIGAELDAIAVDPATEGPDRLENLFRVMHTLKGAARSVGIAEFENACHRCETLLSDLIQTRAPLDANVIRFVQEAADTLSGFVAGTLDAEDLARIAPGMPNASTTEAPSESTERYVEPGATPPEAVRPQAGTADSPAQSIRVETARLDRLVVLTENLLGPKLAAAEHAVRAAEIVGELREIRARRTADADTLNALRSIETLAHGLATALRADQRTLLSTIDDLYAELLRVRLTPAASILEGFPLMVRDLCRSTGKDVAWHSTGEHLEIDRKVLGLVKDPLIHLVRNAIDHGIESPHDREAIGKPRRGNVSVAIAPIDGGRISIEVADDGRGFALDAIRDAAVRSRLSSAEHVAAMSDADVAELAFDAGVSTSPVVTTISGHGRGLAIVRESIERVEGRISTHSSPGSGTVIRLELPASIVTYRALLINAERTPFLFPLEAIDRAFPVPRDQVAPALARGLFTVGDEELPFGSLGTVLGLDRASPIGAERSELPCLVVRSGDRRGIVLLDDIAGEHEVVIKDLRPPLRRVRNILATGLLGTGDLVLVLRPLDVLLALQSPPQRQSNTVADAPRVVRVLVVDDSITTRTMERSLFETAGYRVRVAADGLDGWNVLQNESIDLVVSDVDMPRMDGFELTTRIRAHPKFAELPVVLVSALETREDKDRGLRAGANAYVLKSGFDQTALLEIVRRLT